MTNKYNVTVTFTYTNIPAESQEAAQHAAHAFWGSGMRPETYDCNVTVVTPLQELFEAWMTAQKNRIDFMDDIRSNYENGLTQMTPAQNAVLDQLYETENKASDLLMSHPEPMVLTFTKEI